MKIISILFILTTIILFLAIDIVIGGFLIYSCKNYIYIDRKCNNKYNANVTFTVNKTDGTCDLFTNIYYKQNLELSNVIFNVPDCDKYHITQNITVYKQCVFIFYDLYNYYFSPPYEYFMNQTVGQILTFIYLSIHVALIILCIPTLCYVICTILCKQRNKIHNRYNDYNYNMFELDNL